jgi:hypothetical protein
LVFDVFLFAFFFSFDFFFPFFLLVFSLHNVYTANFASGEIVLVC